VRRAGVLAALLAAVAWAYPSPASDGPRVVARTADGAQVAALPLGPARTFALAYRHSVYRVAAEERFRSDRDGRFTLVAIASPSEAVLDYYAIEGLRRHTGGRWVLEPARPPRFRTLALAATRIGRRTLVAGGERFPLWRADGRAAHLRITVEGG
jgi:Domain of unknown function (DUF1850)